jgi:hypothetical protein
MAHLNTIEDETGDLIDLEYFCGDYCAQFSDNYKGWYGCIEIYTPENCQTCNTGLTYVSEDGTIRYPLFEEVNS